MMTLPASMQNKRIIIVCETGCGSKFPLSEKLLSMRAVEGIKNIFSVGFSCPNCARFYHAHYENDYFIRQAGYIRAIADPVERGRAIKRYNVKLRHFQRKVQGMLGEAAKNVPELRTL